MTHLTDICSDKMEKSYADAIQSLGPAVLAGEDQGRAPASTMSPDDRESWQLWSLKQLKQTQDYLDLTDSEPRLREVHEELSGIANDLVIFNGFAQEGRQTRMSSILLRIQGHAWKIRGLVCR